MPKKITYRGQEFPSLAALWRARGAKSLSYNAFQGRAWRGMDLEEALTRPQKFTRHYDRSKAREKSSRANVTFLGITYANQNELCAAHDVKFSTFRKRLSSGWSMGQALGVRYRRGRRGGTSINSRGVPVVVAGVVYPSQSACAKKFGLKPHTIINRLKLGWTPEQAVGIHPPPHGQKRSPVRVAGRRFRSQRAAAEHYGVPINTYRERRRAGWTVKEALGIV